MPETSDPEVDALLAERRHPLDGAVIAIRSLLLAVPDVVESIKWNAPNYALADDFATMSLRRDAAVQLILHTGAKPKPEHPEITVAPLPTFAKRADRNRVVLTFTDSPLTDADAADVERVISAWVAQLV